MTDCKLLELAAKAIGKELFYDTFHDGELCYYEEEIDCNIVWNPLTDDGDALRLAVECGIEYRRITMPHSIGIQAYDGSIMAVYEPYGDDPYAATRRAIVRAAAEIGKSL